jgi:CDP-diacylglycerol--serine O-phosphatidyltransferase
MKITRAVVPSLFTVLNMFSGFMSIIHASRGEFLPSAWFIVLAAGFDALDGIMARITKSSSQFGVEIDSLSDVVSFGAAPAFLAFQFSLHQMGNVGIFLSSLLMIFAGLRLARFNVQLVGFDKDHFVGLPVPASGITVASFVLNVQNNVTGFAGRGLDVLPWLSVLLALLMVSKVPYDTLPKVSRKAIQKEPWKFIFGALAVIVVVVTGGNAIFPLLIAFIAIGMVRYAITFVRRMMNGRQQFEEEEPVTHSRIDT